MAEFKSGFSFPKRRFRSKSRFIRQSKTSTDQGIKFRRYFIKGRSYDIFDEEFDTKPRIYYYAKKLREAMLRDGKTRSPEEYKPDVFAKFMALVRKKLWVEPSLYQRYLYATIAKDAPTRYSEED